MLQFDSPIQISVKQYYCTIKIEYYSSNWLTLCVYTDKKNCKLVNMDTKLHCRDLQMLYEEGNTLMLDLKENHNLQTHIFRYP